MEGANLSRRATFDDKPCALFAALRKADSGGRPAQLCAAEGRILSRRGFSFFYLRPGLSLEAMFGNEITQALPKRRGEE
jgi:hypothetical protein